MLSQRNAFGIPCVLTVGGSQQDYESGARRIPPCVAFCVRLELEIQEAFWAGLPGRVDAGLRAEFGTALIQATASACRESEALHKFCS